MHHGRATTRRLLYTAAISDQGRRLKRGKCPDVQTYNSSGRFNASEGDSVTQMLSYDLLVHNATIQICPICSTCSVHPC